MACWPELRLSIMGFTQVSNIYLDFLDHLNASRVCYAVLHGWESLPRGEVSDIDLILSVSDLERLKASLKERYRILNILHYEASSFGFVLIPKNADLSSIFVADISTDYRWRGRIFFNDQELLKDRRLWNGYWVVGQAEEFAYLLVKKIYEKGSVPDHQRTRLSELAQNLSSEAARITRRLCGPAWGRWLYSSISIENWAAINEQIPRLRRSIGLQAFKRNYLSPFRYLLGEIGRWWNRWRNPTGLLIRLSEPPERGKDSLVQQLQRTFGKAFRRVAVFDCAATSTAWLFPLKVRLLLVKSTLVILRCSSRCPASNCQLNEWKKNTVYLDTRGPVQSRCELISEFLDARSSSKPRKPGFPALPSSINT